MNLNSFEHILKDERLVKLFFKDAKCAVQLWILQRKDGDSISSRLVYGWILPYFYSDNKWCFPKKNAFKSLEITEVQLIRLDANLDSSVLICFLQAFYKGEKISQASEDLIRMTDDFNDRFGDLVLDEKRVIKPVTYLPSQENYEHSGLFSPHSGEGAYSASISSLEKDTFFGGTDVLEKQIFQYVAEMLKKDSGVDLLSKSSARLGELELLCFPGLDVYGRHKLSFFGADQRKQLNIQYELDETEPYDEIILKVEQFNDSQLCQSNLLVYKLNEDRKAIFSVDINEQWQEAVDGQRFELYGKNKNSSELVLIHRSTANFLREVSGQISLVSISGTVANPWLTQYTKLNEKHNRVQAALLIRKSNQKIESHISYRDSDPWVQSNLNIKQTVKLAFPGTTEGKFFPRHTEGEGRLEFVEWWKRIFSQHAGDAFIIFDPYFEDIGVGLLACYATDNSNITIFTNKSDRINKIIKAYIKCRDLFQNSRLMVYSIDNIHDRYFLIQDKSGEITKGFSLSNSIQKANENYPLLVTPIPTDVLFDVQSYIKDILANGTPEKAFDSMEYQKTINDIKSSKRSTLSSKKERFKSLNQALFQLHSLTPSEFYKEIQIVGNRIAQSDTGSFLYQHSEDIDHLIIVNFYEYLKQRCCETSTEPEGGLANSNIYSCLTSPLSLLMNTLTDFYREICLVTLKPDQLSWADYYTVKILWMFDSAAFVGFIEERISSLYKFDGNSIKLLMIAQAVSEFYESCIRDAKEFSAERFLKSPNGLLRWIGYFYIERMMNKSGSDEPFFFTQNNLSKKDKIQFIGWLLNRNAHNHKDSKWCDVLSVHLVDDVLSESLNTEDVRWLTNSVRGRMKRLGYTEPWFSTKILNPLVDADKVNYDDFLQIWMEEMVFLLDNIFSDSFNLSNSDIKTTKIAAFMFSRSSCTSQKTAINTLLSKVKKAGRSIRRPMSAGIDWCLWDRSLKLAVWIYGVINWAMCYATESIETRRECMELTQLIEKILIFKPKEIWEEDCKINNEAWCLFFGKPPVSPTNVPASRYHLINTKLTHHGYLMLI